MRFVYVFTFLIIISFSSCQKKLAVSTGNTGTVSAPALKSISGRITAFDISENASPLSTGNDEMMIFVYTPSKKQNIPDLLYQQYMIFDKNKNVFNFEIQDAQEKELTVILIEMDTEKPITQVEPVVRLNLEKLKRATIGDLKNLLDDDDLIGIQSVSAIKKGDKTRQIEFKGEHLFDPFHYVIEFGN